MRDTEVEYLKREFESMPGPKEPGAWQNFAVVDSKGVIHSVSNGAESLRTLKKVKGTKNSHYMPDGTVGAIPGNAAP